MLFSSWVQITLFSNRIQLDQIMNYYLSLQKSEKEPCRKIGQLGFNKQRRKHQKELISHSFTPLDFALVRLSGTDIAQTYSCSHLSNPYHSKASSFDRASSAHAEELRKIGFRVKTIDLTMLYLAKNNLEYRTVHQLSEEFSIHCFYFRVANALVGAKAIFALKDLRKKQRIFHNKQILRPVDNASNKLLFCHFSKNTQSAHSFHDA